MEIKHKDSTWQQMRSLFNTLHLWNGLASGLIIFVVCFSGTIYTYNTEIRELASPHFHHVKAEVKKLKIEELLNSIKQDYSGSITAIKIPNDPFRSYEITSRSPNDKSRSGVIYYVDPYTGALLGTNGTKTKTDDFMANLSSLHR